MEAGEACLEADLLASILHNYILILVLLVGMIKLRDFFEDPEGLTVKLLLQVERQHILECVLLAH